MKSSLIFFILSYSLFLIWIKPSSAQDSSPEDFMDGDDDDILDRKKRQIIRTTTASPNQRRCCSMKCPIGQHCEYNNTWPMPMPMPIPCTRPPCPTPRPNNNQQCVPNCPYGEQWVDCPNCKKDNFCSSPTFPPFPGPIWPINNGNGLGTGNNGFGNGNNGFGNTGFGNGFGNNGMTGIENRLRRPRLDKACNPPGYCICPPGQFRTRNGRCTEWCPLSSTFPEPWSG